MRFINSLEAKAHLRMERIVIWSARVVRGLICMSVLLMMGFERFVVGLSDVSLWDGRSCSGISLVVGGCRSRSILMGDWQREANETWKFERNEIAYLYWLYL